MSAAQLPPAEPPADDVATVLEKLRYARAELREAERVLAMLAILGDVDNPASYTVHLEVEGHTAERRIELWRAVVARLEEQARALGLRP